MSLSLARTAVTRVLRPAAAALVALGLVSGCQAHPGQAAVLTYWDLEGRRSTLSVSEADVSQAVADLAPLQLDRSSAVSSMFQLPMLTEASQGVGVQVQEDEVDALAKDLFDKVGRPVPELSQGAREVLRFQVLYAKVSQLPPEDTQQVDSAMSVMVKTADLQASPRYQDKNWLTAPVNPVEGHGPGEGR